MPWFKSKNLEAGRVRRPYPPTQTQITQPVEPAASRQPSFFEVEGNICHSDCILRQVANIHSSKSVSYDYAHIIPGKLSEEDRQYSRRLYRLLRPWQTRLIQLSPGEHDSDFPTCRMVTVEFIDMPGVGISETGEVVSYSAVSYVWGQTALDSAILCNGINLPICTSLAVALFHLSKSRKRQYLWCDAICIDQCNSSERALQVRNMLRIFEKADIVIAWMGRFPQYSLECLALVNDLGLSDKSLLSVMERTHEKMCILGLETLEKSLGCFVSEVYFTRTWIRQEIFGAKSISFRFADFEMALDLQNPNFTLWAQKFHARETKFDLLKVEMADRQDKDRATHFRTMVKHIKHNGTESRSYVPPQPKMGYSTYWLMTLQDGTALQVTDPRDRIYALLGVLSSPTTRLYVDDHLGQISRSFPIDYDKTVSEVYADVMKHLINADRNLDCLCVFQDRRKHAEDLPSWVLDWRHSTARYFICTKPDPAEFRERYGQALEQDLSDPLVLSINGYTVTKVTSIEGHNQLSDVDNSSFKDIGDLAQHYVRISRGYRSLDGANVGYYGPRNCMLDDRIIFADGATFPLVLRPLAESRFRFIGPAVMDIYPDPKPAHRLPPSGLRWDHADKCYVRDWEVKADKIQTYNLV